MAQAEREALLTRWEYIMGGKWRWVPFDTGLELAKAMAAAVGTGI